MSPRESPALTLGVHQGTIVVSTVEKRSSQLSLMESEQALGSPNAHLGCHPFLTEAAMEGTLDCALARGFIEAAHGCQMARHRRRPKGRTRVLSDTLG